MDKLILIVLFILPLVGAAPRPSPSPSTQPQQDRRGGSGSASAMAAVGAAIAGASCAALMAKAMEEEEPEIKELYMMMAMQQCAQAAQNAANAAQNGQGKEKASSEAPKDPNLYIADVTAGPSFPTQPPPDSPVTGIDTEKPESEELSPLPVATEAPQDKEPVTEQASALTVTPVSPASTPDLPSSIPESLPRSKLGYDERNKTESSSPGKSSDGAAPSLAHGGLAFSTPPPTSGLEPIRSESKRGRFTETSSTETAGGGDGAAPSGDAKGQESPSRLDEMLSLLLPKDSEGESGVGAQDEALTLGKGEETEEVNIFEFASFWYRKLHRVGSL